MTWSNQIEQIQFSTANFLFIQKIETLPYFHFLQKRLTVSRPDIKTIVMKTPSNLCFMYKKRRAIVPAQGVHMWLALNAIYMVNLHILVVSFAVSLSLLLIHTYFMLTNTTTWERFSRKNITYLRAIKSSRANPFHEGYLRNTCRFLCSCGAASWENVYVRFTNKIPSHNLATSAASDVEMGQVTMQNQQNIETSSSD